MTASATGRPRRLAAPGTALAAGLLIVAMTAAAGIFSAAAHRPVISGLNVVVLYLAFAALGVVVAWHQPRNAIGWLLLGVGFLFTVSAAAGGYAVLDYRLHGGRLPLGWLAVLLQPGWAPAIALAGTIMPLFPDGRLPSRRWRRWLWPYLALAGLWVAGTLIVSADALLTGHVQITAGGDLTALNSATGAAAWWGLISAVFFPVIGLTWLTWLVLQVAGYRRAPAERREQLKWLLSGATVFIIGTGISVWLNSATGTAKVVSDVAGAGMFALPVSIGIGILRFRLYDIDRIVSRTVAYTLVTGLLVGVYTGLVLLATQVLPLPGPVAVAAATLAAAAMFSPLRRRTQHLVDRRFNRARYDADAAIGAFAARMAGAADPGAVYGDLLATVGKALEPTHVTIWQPGAQR